MKYTCEVCARLVDETEHARGRIQSDDLVYFDAQTVCPECFEKRRITDPKPWIDAGFTSKSERTKWSLYGFDPDEASKWTGLMRTPEQAYSLRQAHLDPTADSWWIDWTNPQTLQERRKELQILFKEIEREFRQLETSIHNANGRATRSIDPLIKSVHGDMNSATLNVQHIKDKLKHFFRLTRL